MTSLRTGFVTLVLLGVLGACPSRPSDDAGRDATTDALVELDTASDAAACPLRCASTRERCCVGEDGVPRCIDVSSDVHNCGLCGLDCIATRRGDACQAMQCTCGGFDIGCTGQFGSICCPGGSRAYCANLGTSVNDCGACGRGCDAEQADSCGAGRCTCGTGASCAGDPASRCCVDRTGFATCVDTTSDPFHCGSCNRLCTGFERCVDGTCVPT